MFIRDGKKLYFIINRCAELIDQRLIGRLFQSDGGLCFNANLPTFFFFSNKLGTKLWQSALSLAVFHSGIIHLNLMNWFRFSSI